MDDDKVVTRLITMQRCKNEDIFIQQIHIIRFFFLVECHLYPQIYFLASCFHVHAKLRNNITEGLKIHVDVDLDAGSDAHADTYTDVGLHVDCLTALPCTIQILS